MRWALGMLAAVAVATPADAQVVVQAPGAPAAAPVTLSATDVTSSQEALRLTLRGPDPGGETPTFEQDEVGLAPLWDDELITVSEDVADNGKTHTVHLGGAVAASVASVEITAAPGIVVRVDTVPGDGYAGRDKGYVRFFLTTLNLPTDTDGDDGPFRLLDAGGRLLAIVKAPDTRRTVRVLGERVRADLSSQVSPVPGQPERRTERFCLNGNVGEFDACHDAGRGQALLVVGGRVACPGRPALLAALAPPGAQRLRVTLGSGRVLRLPTRAAPFGRAERIVAAQLPSGEAVRSATALSASNAALATADVRSAARLPCSGYVGYGADSAQPATAFGVPAGTQLAAAAGDLRLLVRDDGDLICAAFNRFALDGRQCGEPPVNSHQSAIYQSAHGVIVAYVAARVATVDVRLDDASHLRLPTAPGVEYSGRYRDALRFAMAQLPAGRNVRDAKLLDAAGHTIGTADREDEPSTGLPRAPSNVITRDAGGQRVRLQVAGVDDATTPCLDLVVGAQAFDDDDCLTARRAGDSDLRVTASCAPRRMLVWGRVAQRVRRVEIVLADKRVVRARLVALRPAFRPRVRVFLAVLPARAAMTRVRFIGHGNISTPFPAARAQCGYDFSDDVI